MISEKKLQALYQESRLFIHPIEEAFGMGGLEAAANGCPIVIPESSGISGYLTNNYDGIFIKKASQKDFILAAKRLWYDPQLSRKMGMSARKKILHMNWENHAKNLVSIIDKALSHSEKNIVALETGHASASYLSGGDKILEKMATYFPQNFKIKVILPEIGVEHWIKSGNPNVQIFTLPKTIFDGNNNPTQVFMAYILRIWNSFWQLMKMKDIDILYSSTNVLPDIAPVFFYKILNPKVPWIARVHHLIKSPKKRPGRLAVNLVSYFMQVVSNSMMKSKSDLTVALNYSLAKSLVGQKFSKNKLIVLGAGIDYEKIANSKKMANVNYDGIFIGRIHPSKGIYDLVQIWQKVVKKIPSAKTIIIGGGSKDQEKKLKTQIKNANLSKNLTFAGYLSDRQVYNYLKSSRIFLFTDYEAGWGIAIAEAMAAGLPVVGYNLEIFGGVFKKGFLTVPLGNTTIFAQKIIQLLENKSNYQQISQEAATQAQKMSWRRTSFKFQKIIKAFPTPVTLTD